jgi:hypothetical protein
MKDINAIDALAFFSAKVLVVHVILYCQLLFCLFSETKAKAILHRRNLSSS